MLTLLAGAVGVPLAGPATADPKPAVSAAPQPCARVVPPRATTTRAADNDVAAELNQERQAALEARFPDRPLSAYSDLNEIGEGWRYRWTGGQMRYVVYLNRYGALQSGTAFAPDPARCPGPRPAVLVNTGITANETLYWWAAQALAEAGYVALTFDFMGQGLSEANGHDAAGAPVPQTCADATCARGADPATGFLQDAEDALDFLLSSPSRPYPHTGPRLASDGDFDAAFPFAGQVDATRVAVAGHSEGARVASVLQRDPRVDAVIGMDNLASTLKGDAGSANSQCRAGGGGLGFDAVPVEPRVPALGQAAPNNTLCGDPELKKVAYEHWRARGLPAQQVVFANTVHAGDWSPTPAAGTSNPWGTDLASHYNVAWLDRWLLGDVTAEQRLYATTFDLFDHYLGPLRVTSQDALDVTFTSSADTGTHRCADLRTGCPPPAIAVDRPGRSDGREQGSDRGQGGGAGGGGDAVAGGAGPPALPRLDLDPPLALPVAPLAGAAPLPVTFQPAAAAPAADVAGAGLLALLPLAGLVMGLGVLVGRRRHVAAARALAAAPTT